MVNGRHHIRYLLMKKRSSSKKKSIEWLDSYRDDFCDEQKIPELKAIVGYDQQNPWHPYDLWEHTIRTIAYCPSSDFLTRTAALLHDIGKPQCAKRGEDGYLHYKGHGEVSAEMAKPILYRLGYSPRETFLICELIRNHNLFIEETPKFMDKLYEQMGKTQVLRLLDLREGDVKAQTEEKSEERFAKIERIRKYIEALPDNDYEFETKNKLVGCELCCGIPKDESEETIGDIRLQNKKILRREKDGWETIIQDVAFCPKCGRSFRTSPVCAEFRFGELICSIDRKKDDSGQPLLILKARQQLDKTPVVKIALEQTYDDKGIAHAKFHTEELPVADDTFRNLKN